MITNTSPEKGRGPLTYWTTRRGVEASTLTVGTGVPWSSGRA
jgi:hypothetical protein